MNFNLQLGVQADFQCIVRNSELEETNRSGVSPNMVLNAGLDRMSVGGWVNACMVGSNNTPPNPLQTALLSPVARTTAVLEQYTRVNNTVEPYYQEVEVIWRFPQGAAQGLLSEVAAGWGTTAAGEAFDRALILDSGGLPTTLAILATDFLDVRFRLRIYYTMLTSSSTINVVDEVGTILSTHTLDTTIGLDKPLANGYNEGYISGMLSQPVRGLKRGGNNTNSQWFDQWYTNIPTWPDFKGALNGTQVPGIGWNSPGYTMTNTYPDSRTNVATSFIPITAGNGDYHGASLHNSLGVLRWRVTPKFPKLNTETLRVTVTTTWAAYTG